MAPLHPMKLARLQRPPSVPNDVHTRLRAYSRLGLALAVVWLVDPEGRSVTVYRPNQLPQVFEGDDVLAGSVTLEIDRSSDKSCLLPLAPWTPAIGRGAWRTSAQPARIGTSPNGALALLVEGASLDLEWSLRGERTASGAVAVTVTVS